MVKRFPKKEIQVNLLDHEQAEQIAGEILSKMEANPGMTLKDATGISDKVLEEIYALAFTYYNQGKYGEAAALFHFLTGTCPCNYKYMLGLAACYHQAGAYEQAAIAFFTALRIEPDNPIPAYYVTDCFLKQGLKDEALEFAEVTALICEGKPEHSELKQRCELIAENLKIKK